MRAATNILGAPVTRVEGALKVTGDARFPVDVSVPGQAYAVLVQSAIVRGRIIAIATNLAERAPGVVTIVTHANTPKFPSGPVPHHPILLLTPLQSCDVLHYGQHVAMVIADTLEQAHAAAGLITVTYEQAPPRVSLDDSSGVPESHPWLPDQPREKAAAAFESTDHRLDEAYVTAANFHHPIGPFATVAQWQGDVLILHDTTQWPHGVKETLAHVFGIASGKVQVRIPYVGGAFGAGLRVWPHVTLAALGARLANRPVKLVLTRAQMCTSLGYRPMSRQRLRIAASRNGQLTSIEHNATSPLSINGSFFNPVAVGTREAYACPHVATRHRQVRLNVTLPAWARAPGYAEGSFALESAVDEIAYLLEIDPLELRVRNHTSVHPPTRRPWSSNALMQCYRVGAARFGWNARPRTTRSIRDGRHLIGYGMARAALSAYQEPCRALASICRDGSARLCSGATDVGVGTYTIATQIAAELLALPVDRVVVRLGDSTMPQAPRQGGSGMTAALGNAIQSACLQILRRMVDLATRDRRSALHGCAIETLEVCHGGIRRLGQPATHDTFVDILERNGIDEVTCDGASEPPNEHTSGPELTLHLGQFVPWVRPLTTAVRYAGPFAAHFVEVRVDPDLGVIRVARVVSVVDGGRILNEKIARSQIVGGIVGGIGMALLEEAISVNGRPITTSLGDYLIPVNADVPDIDVSFVGAPDPMTEVGAKGIGEIAVVGVAAAIANAVFHATGKRIRTLPLSPDKVMD